MLIGRPARPWHEEMGREEARSHRPWSAGRPPTRVLVMRFHAVGDVAVTLPACVGLRARLPHARLDFLTTEACADLVRALDLFDHVHALRLGARRQARVLDTVVRAVAVRRQRYDVVVDLQRQRKSRAIRRVGAPAAWAEFDRFGARAAGERVLETFHRAGFSTLSPVCRLPVRSALLDRARDILRRRGWDGAERLIVLNPAGLWETRNWPLASYAALARRWLARERARFLLLGVGAMAAKAAWLRGELGAAAIDLVGETTLAEDLAILQHVSVVISEDAGLMHMAWTSGVPTVALLGASPAVWVRPLGPHARHLDSSDLPCGACMRPTCRHADVRCLTRYTPERVLALAREAMAVPDRPWPPV